MKTAELKKKNAEELKEMLGSLEEEHFNLRVQKAMGQLQNTSRIRLVRKDIARINTFLAENNAVDKR
ncbi:MAG TPA: 50S ribosomal protein L29 [bacterium]|nr:50S ribosomal protein L29 [bacterium]